MVVNARIEVQLGRAWVSMQNTGKPKRVNDASIAFVLAAQLSVPDYLELVMMKSQGQDQLYSDKIPLFLVSPFSPEFPSSLMSTAVLSPYSVGKM